MEQASRNRDDSDDTDDSWLRNIGHGREAWSDSINELYGQACAITFAVASDLVFDHLNDDLEALAKERRAGR
jgi:hypothetical protein